MPLNKVILCGRLGKDPELKYLQNGNACTSMSVATSESWKDQNGQKQEKTEWHRVVVYGKMAEAAGNYLKKGSEAIFEGKLQTRSWDDGNGNKKYLTEILAQNVQFIGSAKNNNQNQNNNQNRAQNQGQGYNANHSTYTADDIPFDKMF